MLNMCLLEKGRPAVLFQSKPTAYVRGLEVHKHSTAFWCPSCGEVWARMAILKSERKWHCAHETCQDCRGRGSVYRGCYDYFFEDFPKEILEREVEIAARDPKLYSYIRDFMGW